MTINTNTNFTQTCQQIINDAFSLIAMNGNGRSLNANDSLFGQNQLNKMIKSWATQGLHLWAKNEGILFLNPNQGKYTFNANSPYTYAADASTVVVTATTASSSIGSNIITVLFNSNNIGSTIANNNNIGIVNPDNTIFWTTVLSIVGNTITLNANLPQTINTNTLIYSFTNFISKPERILNCRRTLGYDNGNIGTISEVNMTAMSYEDYQSMTNKYTSGLPISYVYNPNVTTGDLYLWLRPNDGNYRISFTYERVINDLDNLTDNFDFPSEWLEPLTWQLAVRLGPAYGRGQKVLQEILPIASEMLENLKAWDNEITYVNIYPDMREN